MDSVLAGAFAGGVTTAAMHPFDVAKIRLQLRRNSSFSQALGELWRSPIKEAYRGLTPNLIGNAAAWGAYFGNYELLQGIAFGEPLNIRPSGSSYLVCSFTAGVLSQAMTNPIWVLKTRILGTRRSDPGSSASVWKTAKQVYAHGGIAGFWRGFLPGTLGTVQSAMYFSIYGPLKPWLKAKYDLPDTATYFVASAVAKSVAATVMYPHQVVRARMQFSEVGMLAAIKETWFKEGWHGFYRGLSVNLARVVPAMAITLVTYELTKKQLSAPPPPIGQVNK